MSTKPPLPKRAEIIERMGWTRAMLVTAGGLGCIQPFGGTWGSLPPTVVAFVLAWAAVPEWQLNVSLVVLGLIGCVACIRFGSLAEEAYGRKDPNPVVADEIAGQAIALLALPWHLGEFWWNGFLAGSAFIAFRIFDIIKPPPARNLEHIKGGMGILVDDLVAGAMALAVVQVVWRLFV
jgi:phosphatidylglycerophosphatase A